MSYILEALKKSDAERKRGEVPTLNDTPQAPEVSPTNASKIWLLIIAGGFGIAGIVALLVTNLQEAPTPTPQVVKVQPAPILAPTPVPKPAPAPKPVAKPEPKPAPAPAPEPVPKPKAVPKPLAKPIPVPLQKYQPVVAAKPSLPALDNASAYLDRAWASMDKSLYAQAIRDLNHAVKLEPAFADAWFARGWAQEKNGDEVAATVDYGHAINVKPDHAFALFSRGYLNLYNGQPQAASVDFLRAQGVAKDDTFRLYSRLWLYLSRVRTGQDAQARLKEDAANESLAAWPGPVVLHLLDALDEGGVINAIENQDVEGLTERRATGYFFLGITNQVAGNATAARGFFEKTLSTGAVEFRQYDAARRELERLTP